MKSRAEKHINRDRCYLHKKKGTMRSITKKIGESFLNVSGFFANVFQGSKNNFN